MAFFTFPVFYLIDLVLSKLLKKGKISEDLTRETYEINKGADSLNVEFLMANRQFDWIEISIVLDKSDKYATIFDSYNRELAAQEIKTLKLSNFTEIYSLANEKKYHFSNLTQRHLLYKQFVAWNCNV